ncbi:polyhydroxybutyrate depolymerase [uncultured Roseibium sp.]|uniref:alpha/beta hydrolase family esterase n=1 Tax=uncultured Roseibium sp. TaxID=1936171 RepID=UPI002596CB7F|nr:polyhydroxybutyrate depolymerase [uncultured Roseibium sp.]
MPSKKSVLAISFWWALALQPAVAADACGGEVPCELEEGTYYALLPDDAETVPPVGAVFYLHGYRGKALNAVRNASFKKLANDLNVVFVAVQGINGTWSFPTAPQNLRDESVFFDAVLDDVEDRFHIDREKTLLTGFSSGGFMTWYLACDDADRFAGYAPIAGAFWKPLPEECPTEAPYLFHVHGTSDTVVPLEGRPLGGGKYHQGDVFKSFDVWLQQLGLTDDKPMTYDDGSLSCERWSPETGLLELCLHDGGHNVRAEWMERAWHELGKLKGWS